MFQNHAVGIRLTLGNQVTHGPPGLSRQVTHLHRQATALQTQVTRIGMLVVGVFMALGIRQHSWRWRFLQDRGGRLWRWPALEAPLHDFHRRS